MTIPDKVVTAAAEQMCDHTQHDPCSRCLWKAPYVLAAAFAALPDAQDEVEQATGHYYEVATLIALARMGEVD